VARLPSPERAAIVAERIMRDDLDSGWGIRTLSTGAASYNPLSYHNGSVWPHDNSLLAAGLFAYGHARAGNRILQALIDAALTDPQVRLPELSCGFARSNEAGAAPIQYPVTCRPQAWAAGSIPFVLRAALGLDVDPISGTVRVDPMLPGWLSTVEIDPIPVRGERSRLVVTRDRNAERYTIEQG
jgi:glycogen debranching enzyme